MTGLMFQGTGSDVGKSLLVAGLCRLLTRRGLRVRPFKPQNMSNNAAVTADGGEIGRAQALQAQACKVVPSVDMNPVLLKPQSEVGSQVVVRGQVLTTARASDYQKLKPSLLPVVLESFARLTSEADVVLVEGAGSPAEVNLRAGDIANMGFALAARVPVVLIGDIDRGGVIASLVGTHALLPAEERALIRGYLINKFRGDPRLFKDGLTLITRYTGWPGYGLVPWFAGATRLPAEDAAGLTTGMGRVPGGGGLRGPSLPVTADRKVLRIAVPHLPHIANFDDFDPLAAEPGVRLVLVPPGRPIPQDSDLILLPGSKATLADLAFLRAEGWEIDLRAHLRQGRPVWGICGGYQMLGRWIEDPDGSEGPPGRVEGLGLLDIETVLAGEKILVFTEGIELSTGRAVAGYEMHIGRTTGPDTIRPMIRLTGGEIQDGGFQAKGLQKSDRGWADGAVSPDGLVRGCYLHGLFGADEFRGAFLSALGAASWEGESHRARVEATLEELADHLDRHVDLAALLAVAS
jgi:adenosylcobyric acid synthase